MMRPASIVSTLILVASLFLILPTAAIATGTSRVLVIENGQHELSVRIAAELKAQGMEPAVLPESLAAVPDSNDSQHIRQFLDIHHAVALFEIHPDGNRIVIHLNNETVRREITAEPGTAQSPALIAFKSVEMLRALLIVTNTPQTEQAPPQKTSPHRQSTRGETKGYSGPRLGVQFQPGLLYGFGKLPPAVQIDSGILIQLSRNMQLIAHGVIPTMTAHFERAEGNVSARASMVGIRLITMWPISSAFQLHFGAGIGYAFLSLSGDAKTPWHSESALLTTTVPEVIGGLSIGFNNKIRFRLDVTSGWTLHELVIRSAGKSVSRWGRPLWGLFGGIELWFM